MQLSPEQSRALDAISLWLKSRAQPFYYLTGAAGTGKTTLAKYIADTWSGPVAPMAYTGKAALVLTKKGLPATTIHRKIYLPATERSEEADELRAKLDSADPKESRRITRRLEELSSPSFVLRPTSPFAPNTLIILDEVSMVDEPTARDLLSFNLPILVLGDRHQLPPISGAGYFTQKADFELLEIHRQAAESPVIRLANLAREGRALPSGAHGSSLVTTRRAVTRDLALSCSQIICGSNRARKQLNAEMRAFQNFTAALPQKGERLICLRNNPKDGLLNGQMIDLAEDARALDSGLVNIKITDGYSVLAHRKCFSDPDSLKTWPFKSRARANEFDWAWAVTCHKMQGSQTESALVWADMFAWDRDLFKKWLYTAISRCEEKVVVAL